MTIEELKAKVLGIVAEALNKKVEEIIPTAKLVAELGADDVDIVEIVMTLEDTYSIEISDDVLDKLITVEDVIAYIYSKVGQPKESGD